MEEIRKRWWAYLLAIAIGFIPGLLIGKSSKGLQQPQSINASNMDSASKEKSGYVLDSGLTR